MKGQSGRLIGGGLMTWDLAKGEICFFDTSGTMYRKISGQLTPKDVKRWWNRWQKGKVER